MKLYILFFRYTTQHAANVPPKSHRLSNKRSQCQALETLLICRSGEFMNLPKQYRLLQLYFAVY